MRFARVRACICMADRITWRRIIFKINLDRYFSENDTFLYDSCSSILCHCAALQLDGLSEALDNDIRIFVYVAALSNHVRVSFFFQTCIFVLLHVCSMMHNVSNTDAFIIRKFVLVLHPLLFLDRSKCSMERKLTREEGSK